MISEAVVIDVDTSYRWNGQIVIIRIITRNSHRYFEELIAVLNVVVHAFHMDSLGLIPVIRGKDEGICFNTAFCRRRGIQMDRHIGSRRLIQDNGEFIAVAGFIRDQSFRWADGNPWFAGIGFDDVVGIGLVIGIGLIVGIGTAACFTVVAIKQGDRSIQI